MRTAISALDSLVDFFGVQDGGGVANEFVDRTVSFPFVLWEHCLHDKEMFNITQLVKTCKFANFYPTKHLVIAGHSMGGHGAWILAAHLLNSKLIGIAALVCENIELFISSAPEPYCI